MLNERLRDWDNIPIDCIEKAQIVLRAERQIISRKLKDTTVMPVTNIDLIH